MISFYFASERGKQPPTPKPTKNLPTMSTERAEFSSVSPSPEPKTTPWFWSEYLANLAFGFHAHVFLFIISSPAILPFLSVEEMFLSVANR